MLHELCEDDAKVQCLLRPFLHYSDEIIHSVLLLGLASCTWYTPPNSLLGMRFQVLCEGVQPGEGRTQECLRKKRVSLSWDCQEELFRKEVNLLRTLGRLSHVSVNVSMFSRTLALATDIGPEACSS
jgi:hypothetical protein